MRTNLNNIVAKNVRQVLREYTGSKTDGAYEYQGTGDKERLKTIGNKAYGYLGSKGRPQHSKEQEDRDTDRYAKMIGSDEGAGNFSKYGAKNSKAMKIADIRGEISELLESEIEWTDDEAETLNDINTELGNLMTRTVRNGNANRGYRVPEVDDEDKMNINDISAY